MSSTNSYQPPVHGLLSLGKPHIIEWHDYATFGITSEHVPDLIRMATDESLRNAPSDAGLVWAPLHALRALGQLESVEAVAPLLGLLHCIDDYEDDWLSTDLPEALGQIGMAAIKPVAAYLADTSHGEWARIAAAEALGKIGFIHDDLRAECAGRLAAQLENFSGQPEHFNAFLLSPLLDLSAIEAMPVIERAFAADRIDESIVGDLEDVQIHFGLKPTREYPRLFAAQQDDSIALMDDANYGPKPEPCVAPPRIGRNEPCPCGSGKKYKKCCGA